MAQERFENFEILRREDGSLWELGRGGMGVTYKARDIDLHRDAALKIIHPAIVESPDARERFLREARAAARLQHPNIAGVMRLGRADDGSHFYAMDFCDGPTLDVAVAERGALPPGEAAEVARQVCAALVVAESHGIVHRDLKPSNLILTQRPGEGLVVKVIDFGLAKAVGDIHQTLATAGSGGFSGTAHFASPEQLEELPVDSRSDLYSLGACLWFMLTARPVFEGSLARVMSQTLTTEPPWERLEGQPDSLIALLRTLLAKHPDERPASAASLKVELDAITAELGPLPAVESPPPRATTARISTTQRRAAPGRGSSHSTSLTPAAGGMAPADFSLRFPLFESLGREPLGRAVRGVDLQGQNAPVRLLAIDPSLTAVPAVRREILSRLASVMQQPHASLMVPLAYTEDTDGILVAFPKFEGETLMHILQEASGQLPPGEVAAILASLAEVADHASAAGLAGTSFAKEEVMVARSADGKEWSAKVPALSAASLGGSGQDQATLFSMATRAPSSTASIAAAGYPAATVLARLACELLGGHMDAQGRIAPLPALNEAGNSVLARACRPGAGEEFPSAQAFVSAWVATLGSSKRNVRLQKQAPTAAPPRPAALPVRRPQPKPPASAPAPPPKKTAVPARNPKLWGAVAGAAALIAVSVWFFGFHKADKTEPADTSGDKAKLATAQEKNPPAEKPAPPPSQPVASTPTPVNAPTVAATVVKPSPAPMPAATPAPPAAAPPINPAPPPQPAVEQGPSPIEKFVASYLESQNKRQFSAAAGHYADGVVYFGEYLSREKVIEKQRIYFSTIPESTETLLGKIRTFPGLDDAIRVEFDTELVARYPAKQKQSIRRPVNKWLVRPLPGGTFAIESQTNNGPAAVESAYVPEPPLPGTPAGPTVLEAKDFAAWAGKSTAGKFAVGKFGVRKVEGAVVIFNPVLPNNQRNLAVELHVHFLDGVEKKLTTSNTITFAATSKIEITEVVSGNGKVIAEAQVDAEWK